MSALSERTARNTPRSGRGSSCGSSREIQQKTSETSACRRERFYPGKPASTPPTLMARAWIPPVDCATLTYVSSADCSPKVCHCPDGFLCIAIPQHGDLRLSDPPSNQDAGGGARTCDRRISE
ncbi:hypothetical protein PoB_006894200 [Plakobranchus ocellatus]|uniref:Uncharacterized protein n=1 Tax=Plakobranchus ocellatus TaxID=259542 RepID=A0AAV4DDV6_9GAST|nr:hypothetical protein PoB_006894200 [Plakobranchus ocellatus]